jgi:hypothetical protein
MCIRRLKSTWAQSGGKEMVVFQKVKESQGLKIQGGSKILEEGRGGQYVLKTFPFCVFLLLL